MKYIYQILSYFIVILVVIIIYNNLNYAKNIDYKNHINQLHLQNESFEPNHREPFAIPATVGVRNYVQQGAGTNSRQGSAGRPNPQAPTPRIPRCVYARSTLRGAVTSANACFHRNTRGSSQFDQRPN